MSVKFISNKETGSLSHYDIIDKMAAEGWRFVGHIPTHPEMFYYDLVFERDIEE